VLCGCVCCVRVRTLCVLCECVCVHASVCMCACVHVWVCVLCGCVCCVRVRTLCVLCECVCVHASMCVCACVWRIWPSYLFTNVLTLTNVLPRCLDPVLTRDAITRGCWWIRVRGYTGLMQKHWGRQDLCVRRENCCVPHCEWGNSSWSKWIKLLAVLTIFHLLLQAWSGHRSYLGRAEFLLQS